jgi:hypothetical protein
LNAATKDVDLSFRGEIDLRDTNNLAVNLTTLSPIFDLTSLPIDCANKIEFAPAGTTLSPAIASFELHGGLFQSSWTIALKESVNAQSTDALNLKEGTRRLSLCLGAGSDEKTLLLGAAARPEPAKPRKRTKRR